MKALLTRLVCAEDGQDLIEYALLSAGLGLVGMAAWPAITTSVGVVYGQLDQQTQGLWRVPNPTAP